MKEDTKIKIKQFLLYVLVPLIFFLISLTIVFTNFVIPKLTEALG